MKEPTWLTKEYVIAIHAEQIREHGGHHGLRDEALLESALYRPQHAFHYANTDIFSLAAAYGYGLIKNHPFIDGNKRTGIVATGVFLLIHNTKLVVPEPELVLTTLAVANDELSEAAFAKWLKQNHQVVKK